MRASVIEAFGVGAAAFWIAEMLWFGVHSVIGANSPWVLEPTAGILFGCVLIAGAAAWLGQRHDPGVTSTWLLALVAYVGACLALTVTLFQFGPGNIWPIVLVIDYAMVAPCVFLGVFIGDFARRHWKG